MSYRSSPSATARLKNREAALKIKKGSPKLQETLRQRCRDHMRAKRGQLFNKFRCGLSNNDELHEVLSDIVREELSSLVSAGLIASGESELLDLDQAVNLENDILAEEEMWMMEEYEKLFENEQAMLASYAEDELEEKVVCPVCQKAMLAEGANVIHCTLCSLVLPPSISVIDLGRLIKNNINLHSEGCKEVPSFMIIPENNNNCLYLICEPCSVLVSII